MHDPGPRARRRIVAPVAGVLTWAACVRGPLDDRADERLAWHMVQHVVLVAVVAPLLAAARAPSRAEPAGTGARRAPRPAVTGAVATAWLACVVAWHVPALYDAALRDARVHALEHVVLVAVTVLLAVALGGVARRGWNVLWLHVLAIPMSLVGVGMTFARAPWYRPYVLRSGAAAALADQQLAGVVMWSAGGASAAGSAVWLFVRWLRDEASTTTAGAHA